VNIFDFFLFRGNYGESLVFPSTATEASAVAKTDAAGAERTSIHDAALAGLADEPVGPAGGRVAALSDGEFTWLGGRDGASARPARPGPGDPARAAVERLLATL
jgi:hypothetical protein